MSNLIKILIVAAISAFCFTVSNAQNTVVKSDTITSLKESVDSKENVTDQKNTGNRNSDQANKGNNAANKGIKQVRSAKPDMSKARGARPPEIERPSGSRIPKGVGKPGGAINPGKR